MLTEEQRSALIVQLGRHREYFRRLAQRLGEIGPSECTGETLHDHVLLTIRHIDLAIRVLQNPAA